MVRALSSNEVAPQGNGEDINSPQMNPNAVRQPALRCLRLALTIHGGLGIAVEDTGAGRNENPNGQITRANEARRFWHT